MSTSSFRCSEPFTIQYWETRNNKGALRGICGACGEEVERSHNRNPHWQHCPAVAPHHIGEAVSAEPVCRYCHDTGRMAGGAHPCTNCPRGGAAYISAAAPEVVSELRGKPKSPPCSDEGTAAPTHILVSVGDLEALDVILRDIHGLDYADAVRQARIIAAGWLSATHTEP